MRENLKEGKEEESKDNRRIDNRLKKSCQLVTRDQKSNRKSKFVAKYFVPFVVKKSVHLRLKHCLLCG